MRLVFFAGVVAYSYVFAQGGAVGGDGIVGGAMGNGGGRVGKGWLGGAVERWGGDELKNSVVFTWGFVEMLCWFWVSWFS